MPKGLQHKGIVRREKMIQAAVNLLLHNGYEKTTTAAIARAAGMSPSSFFAVFDSKEALLLTLVKTMFEDQFSNADRLMEGAEDPVLLYTVETGLQLYITECSEPLRELYVTAYSLPSTAEYIRRATAERLGQLFAAYMPGAQEKDFYELDIASGGMMRAFMARPCDLYFTMERKLRRFWQCGMSIYHIPEEKQRQVMEDALAMDLETTARGILTDLLRRMEKQIELSAMTD